MSELTSHYMRPVRFVKNTNPEMFAIGVFFADNNELIELVIDPSYRDVVVLSDDIKLYRDYLDLMDPIPTGRRRKKSSAEKTTSVDQPPKVTDPSEYDDQVSVASEHSFEDDTELSDDTAIRYEEPKLRTRRRAWDWGRFTSSKKRGKERRAKKRYKVNRYRCQDVTHCKCGVCRGKDSINDKISNEVPDVKPMQEQKCGCPICTGQSYDTVDMLDPYYYDDQDPYDDYYDDQDPYDDYYDDSYDDPYN